MQVKDNLYKKISLSDFYRQLYFDFKFHLYYFLVYIF